VATTVLLAVAIMETGELIVAFLRGLGITDPIESYSKPYAAIAIDLVSGREIWLQSGSIDEAVRASIALPGIFSPARIGDRWLVDGGLSNPVPVSVCGALGADITIAVNLNGDLLGRRFEELDQQATVAPPHVPNEFVSRLLNQLPDGLRNQVTQIAPRLLPHGSSTPEYFGVLANSINIMQDYITRARLAGEPPHVMLVPRLRHIGLMEFNRAKEAIAEGRLCVEQALPMLRRFVTSGC
jgi:NTE family protein